jgi:antirestriction protein ArdC
MTKTTFTPEDLQKLMAETAAAAVAEALKSVNTSTRKAKGKPGAKVKTDEEKAAARAKTEADTIKNFTAAGYKDVQPRINVMTYNKWIENGRRVKKGEKSIKGGSFPLFHIDQTQAIKAEGTVH